MGVFEIITNVADDRRILKGFSGFRVEFKRDGIAFFGLKFLGVE